MDAGRAHLNISNSRFANPFLPGENCVVPRDEWYAAVQRIKVYARRGDVEGLIREAGAGSTWGGTDSRTTAARRLGKLRDPRATPVLIQLLGDEGSSVRIAAAGALGQIADPAAVPALAGLLGDPVAFAREWRPASLRDLRDLLRREEWPRADQSWAVGSLARIGAHAEVMPALLALLRHDAWRTRVWAAWLISALGATEAIAEVEAARMREPVWRRWRYFGGLRRLRALKRRHLAESSSPRP
jgi:hypothetical protein